MGPLLQRLNESRLHSRETFKDLPQCQRQLNSEHFRQFKIDTLSVDGNSGIVKLTHLPLIAQRFYQWSGLQALFPPSREHPAGMGTSHHHPKFPFYRVILGPHFSPPILRSSCAWVLM